MRDPGIDRLDGRRQSGTTIGDDQLQVVALQRLCREYVLTAV